MGAKQSSVIASIECSSDVVTILPVAMSVFMRIARVSVTDNIDANTVTVDDGHLSSKWSYPLFSAVDSLDAAEKEKLGTIVWRDRPTQELRVTKRALKRLVKTEKTHRVLDDLVPVVVSGSDDPDVWLDEDKNFRWLRLYNSSFPGSKTTLPLVATPKPILRATADAIRYINRPPKSKNVTRKFKIVTVKSTEDPDVWCIHINGTQLRWARHYEFAFPGSQASGPLVVDDAWLGAVRKRKFDDIAKLGKDIGGVRKSIAYDDGKMIITIEPIYD